MPPLSPSVPTPNLSSYYDPEMYRSVRTGVLDKLHTKLKRVSIDASMTVPRWGIVLLILIPLAISFLGVIIYYLWWTRRSKMERITSPIGLQHLEPGGRRYPTLTPNLPELYWPNAIPPACSSPSSDQTVFPGPGSQRVPQQPRRRFDKDKTLPDLPRHVSVEDVDAEEEDCETVRATRDNTFADAFAQHRLDQERRENERRDKDHRARERREQNERSLLEALERRNQRERNQLHDNPYELSAAPAVNNNKKSPEPDQHRGSPCGLRPVPSASAHSRSPELSHDGSQKKRENPHVNEGYTRYRSYRMQLGDETETDIILASDTNTMGPLTTATPNPNATRNNPHYAGAGGGTIRSSRARRHQELTGGSDEHENGDGGSDGDGSHHGLLHRPERAFVRLAASSRQFPSDQSEMDNYTETVLTDDPFVADAKRRARQKK